MCTSVSNIIKDIDEVKAELNRYKGFVEGQLNGLSGEIRGIRKEMLDKMDSTTKDITLMLQDLNKNQSELLNKFVTCTLDNSKTDEQIKLTNNKNIWAFIFKVGAILAPFVTAGLTYIFTK
jgi:chromosome segregation ATPase